MLRNRDIVFPACVVVLTWFVAGFGTPALGTPMPKDPPQKVLALSFEIASAIQHDTKDRAKAQYFVTYDLMRSGNLKLARTYAEQIQGWRKGVVLAELAGEASKQGKRSLALDLLGEAKRVEAETTGWQKPRIAAYVASVEAQVGDVKQAKRILDRLAEEDDQYVGRAAAATAAALVREGKLQQAFDELDLLAESKDIYESWWRTMGYIEIAGNEALSGDQRAIARRRALDSAGAIAGWKRIEALLALVPLFREAGESSSAEQSLEQAAELAGSIPASSPVKARLMGRIARALGQAGRKVRAATLVDRASELVGETMKVERPGILAALAAVDHDLGREQQSRALFLKAVDAAESLVNARPRALAAVAICGELGRHGIDPDGALFARLKSLRAGLRAPW